MYAFVRQEQIKIMQAVKNVLRESLHFSGHTLKFCWWWFYDIRTFAQFVFNFRNHELYNSR